MLSELNLPVKRHWIKIQNLPFILLSKILKLKNLEKLKGEGQIEICQATINQPNMADVAVLIRHDRF